MISTTLHTLGGGGKDDWAWGGTGKQGAGWRGRHHTNKTRDNNPGGKIDAHVIRCPEPFPPASAARFSTTVTLLLTHGWLFRQGGRYK